MYARSATMKTKRAKCECPNANNPKQINYEKGISACVLYVKFVMMNNFGHSRFFLFEGSVMQVEMVVI